MAKVLAFWAICGIISARENAENSKKPCTFVLWVIKIGNVNKCAVEFTQNSETTLILQPA